MNKKDEIRLLTKLCTEDTYFAQFFGKYLHKMIENINNDISIEINLIGGENVLVELTKEDLALLKTVGVQCISWYTNHLDSYGVVEKLIQQQKKLNILINNIDKL